MMDCVLVSGNKGRDGRRREGMVEEGKRILDVVKSEGEGRDNEIKAGERDGVCAMDGEVMGEITL